jgi:hypothetical protein
MIAFSFRCGAIVGVALGLAIHEALGIDRALWVLLGLFICGLLDVWTQRKVGE